jgi:hypothetical protein
MPPHMVFIIPRLTTNWRIRRVRVSLPLIECLLDGRKYFRPGDPLPLPAEEFWPAPIAQPKVTQPSASAAWKVWTSGATTIAELERLLAQAVTQPSAPAPPSASRSR